MIPEQRVLLAVVNCAILDTCRMPIYIGSPSKRKRDVEDYRLDEHARSAFHFLFGKDLESYCNWLDLDPGWLRKKLSTFMHDGRVRMAVSNKEPLRVSEEQRRIYRLNYSLWSKDKTCSTSPEEEKPLLPIKQVMSHFVPSGQESERIILSHLRHGKRPSPKTSSGSKTFTSIAQCLVGRGTEDGEEH
jgi:hypothetical protein